MFIRIEKGSSVPLSRQIAEQIRAQVISGSLLQGAALPSVRQLGRELGVNQNTILKVYERLTADGLLQMRHGEGTFVAEKLRRAGLEDQMDEHRQRLVDELTQIVRQAQMLGFSRRQMKELLDEAVGVVESQMAARESHP